MQRKRKAIATLLGAVLAGSLALGACSSTTSTPTVTATAKVNVVAGENFWGSIVGQIGGKYANVTSIITNPNTDPHEYTSSAADTGVVAQANLVIENGLNYDNWLPAEVQSGVPQIVVANVLGVKNNSTDDFNPHLWYDTDRMPIVAASFTKGLCKVDPAHCAYFKANEAKFDKSLDPILAVEAQIKAKYAGTKVVYTEPVPVFLIDQTGLVALTPPGFAASIQAGTDPSANDTLTMDTLLTDHKVKVLFYNIQTVSPTTAAILAVAHKAGVPVVDVSETLQPEGTSYQAWQLKQAQSLLQKLGG